MNRKERNATFNSPSSTNDLMRQRHSLPEMKHIKLSYNTA